MRNVLFNNHPFGCSLFKRWSFQLTKTDQRKFPFRCSFCLGRLWVACADKKEIDGPWKRRNIYQLYQVLGVPVPVVYFCRGVIFFGCKIFLNFHVSPFERFLGIPRVCFRNMVLSKSCPVFFETTLTRHVTSHLLLVGKGSCAERLGEEFDLLHDL